MRVCSYLLPAISEAPSHQRSNDKFQCWVSSLARTHAPHLALDRADGAFPRLVPPRVEAGVEQSRVCTVEYAL